MAVYLFDFNGVLVDDEMVHFAAFRDVLATRGIALDEESYRHRYFAYDDRRAFEEMLHDAGATFDEATVRACIAEKLPRYLAAVEHDLVMFPGGFSLLSACSKRGPVAIVSGALRVEIDFALARAKAQSAVTTIVAAEDVEACKPDPSGYLEALRRLGARASDAVVIEDSKGGVAAALAAGCKVVGVAHSYSEEELRGAGAHRVVSHVKELDVDALDAMLAGLGA